MSEFTAQTIAYAVLASTFAVIVWVCIRFYPWGPLAVGTGILFVLVVRVIVWAIQTVEGNWP